MTNLMQHASRLALVTVLSATPLALAAQDTATEPMTEPAQEESTEQAPMTDTDAASDTATDDAAAEEMTDTAEAPATDMAPEGDTEAAEGSDATSMTDTAETPMADDTAPDAMAEAPADAAPAEEPVKPVEGQITMQSENTILADDLIGSSVYSDAGESIGDVDDLIVNLDGTVEGVVIGVGGFLGMGEKWVAVEMDSLSTMTDESGTLRLVSSATKADLEAAEAFVTAQDMEAASQATEDPAMVPEAGTAEPVN
ncbi:hypothetical protein DSM110093_01167 [Sulfitobacter sp. DSM 110093]|uniref:PRC-barrel domain-containing protein n=1 Tax=Sulfitobacter sp. DSM 110093 TaxID=2883127 RepID=UPI001FAD85B3|nr:PRC-barrel domain-containing protein [Sulfitobacter sp. DSM 110093]UOA31402.1 hypothetical protein DSM110093_01167 [Sulfitobacter sp. DSM 110093]